MTIEQLIIDIEKIIETEKIEIRDEKLEHLLNDSPLTFEKSKEISKDIEELRLQAHQFDHASSRDSIREILNKYGIK